jgi:probable HAF family extracellular repeat protein
MRHHNQRRRLAALFTLAAAAPALAQTFQAMPDLPGGAFLSRPYAYAYFNAEFVLGMSSGPNGDEAVRWNLTTNTIEGLGDLPGGPFASEAFASSANYGVVFGYGTNAAGNQEAFRWTPAGGMAGLGFLPGDTTSRAYACNMNGDIACGESSSGPITQAFRWTASGMQPLGFLPGSANTFSTARSMSWDGGVLVGWALDGASVMRPFRWTAATGMVDISGGAFAGEARATGGDFIVGVDTTNHRAFIWSQARGFVTLPDLPGATTSEPTAVLNEDRIFGSSGGHAVHWDKGGCGTVYEVIPTGSLYLGQVAPPGWTLTSAVDGSYDHALGVGTNPSGQVQGWWASDLNPAPQCCCGMDYNCDGDAGSDADIESFFACIAGNCPACQYNADFDGDGDVGTDHDIESFFRVLAGDCC